MNVYIIIMVLQINKLCISIVAPQECAQAIIVDNHSSWSLKEKITTGLPGSYGSVIMVEDNN